LPFRRIFHPLNSSLVLTWLIALAYSLSLFNRRLNMGWRVILLLIVVLAFFLTLFRLRAWASGWMPGVVAVLVITWAWRPRLGMVLGVLCVGVSLIYMNDIIGIVILEDNFYSVDSRLAAWKVLLELINVNPFLGLGPANYYWYTPLYSILGFNVQFNSHNQYVDIIAQTGLIGIAFFGWWAFAVARLGWRLREKVAAGFEQAFIYAALGGLAGTLFAGMLGDWILPFVYNVGLNGFRGSIVAWLMLGGLVALDRIYREKEAAVPVGSRQ
jgi:O-antigen ligase